MNYSKNKSHQADHKKAKKVCLKSKMKKVCRCFSALKTTSIQTKPVIGSLFQKDVRRQGLNLKEGCSEEKNYWSEKLKN